jgi:hypothetical protein
MKEMKKKESRPKVNRWLSTSAAIETELLMRAFRPVYLRNHMKSLICPRLLFFFSSSSSLQQH